MLTASSGQDGELIASAVVTDMQRLNIGELVESSLPFRWLARTLLFVVVAYAVVRLTAGVQPLMSVGSSLERAAIMVALIVVEVAVLLFVKIVFRRVI